MSKVFLRPVRKVSVNSVKYVKSYNIIWLLVLLYCHCLTSKFKLLFWKILCNIKDFGDYYWKKKLPIQLPWYVSISWLFVRLQETIIHQLYLNKSDRYYFPCIMFSNYHLFVISRLQRSLIVVTEIFSSCENYHYGNNTLQKMKCVFNFFKHTNYDRICWIQNIEIRDIFLRYDTFYTSYNYGVWYALGPGLIHNDGRQRW